MTRRNKWLLRLAYVIGVALVGFVVLEVAARCMEKRRTARDLRSLQDLHGYDLIAIGDSFVATGERGWVEILETKGWKTLNLGKGGTCPAQYFRLLSRIKQSLTPGQTVIVVLFIGNDFADQAIWNSLGKDKDDYFQKRSQAYLSTSSDLFWPYRPPTSQIRRLAPRLTTCVKKHSALARALSLMRANLRLKNSGTGNGKGSGNREEEDRILSDFLNGRMNEEYVHRVGENAFFLKHHNATAWQRDDEYKKAADDILSMVSSASEDARVYVVPLLDREEIGSFLHQQPIAKNGPFIERLKQVNPRVIDVNPAFVRQFKEENLYLPDGHWSRAGHKLFADLVAQLLADTRKP